jgi:serine protease AprX
MASGSATHRRRPRVLLRSLAALLGTALVAVAPAMPAHADAGPIVSMYVDGFPFAAYPVIANYMIANGMTVSSSTLSFTEIGNGPSGVFMLPQSVRDHYVGEYNNYLTAVAADPTTQLPADMGQMTCVRNGGLPQAPPVSPFTAYAASTLAQQAMHASAFTNAGFTGQGVDVALIDTGVNPLGDFYQPNVLMHGPDFSFDENVPGLAHVDPYGHGTFMASIIHAVAPSARIVSVKVGDAVGNNDVTQIIAAIDWVREHRNSNGLHIKVINLSYGLQSLNKWTADELSKAVDRAWQDGIVVVSAVGNYDATQPTTKVLDAAYNQNVLAVSGYDTGYDATTTTDDFYPSWVVNTSTDTRQPDVAAPGHVAAMYTPNSLQDNVVADEMCNDATLSYPIAGNSDGGTILGSGTSEATAMASGAVALMLSTGSRTAALSPDRVKRMLNANAHPIPNGAKGKSGNGAIDLGAVYAASLPQATYTQNNNTVTGCAVNTPCLQNTRNGHDVVDTTANKVLDGEQDIFGKPFNGAAHSMLASTDQTWSDVPAGCSEMAGTCVGQMWNGNVWAAPPAMSYASPVFATCPQCSLDTDPNTMTPTGFVHNKVTGLDYWPSVAWPKNWAGDDFATANYTGITLNYSTGGFATGWSGNSWRGQAWEGHTWRGNSWRSAEWR